MRQIIQKFLLSFICTWSVSISASNLHEVREMVGLFPDIVYDQKNKAKSIEYNEHIIDFINNNPEVASDLIKSSNIDSNLVMVFIINAYIEQHPREFEDLRSEVCGQSKQGKKCLLSGYMLKNSYTDEKLYKNYKINDEESVFVWKTGRGSHNDEFWVWKVRNARSSGFNVTLLRLDENSEDYNRPKFNLVAQSITFNPEENILVLKGSSYGEKKYLVRDTRLYHLTEKIKKTLHR